MKVIISKLYKENLDLIQERKSLLLINWVIM